MSKATFFVIFKSFPASWPMLNAGPARHIVLINLVPRALFSLFKNGMGFKKKALAAVGRFSNMIRSEISIGRSTSTASRRRVITRRPKERDSKKFSFKMADTETAHDSWFVKEEFFFMVGLAQSRDVILEKHIQRI